MKQAKLTKLELVIAFVMFLCYLAALYFFFTNNRTLLLAFLVLHSCLAVAFFIITQDTYTKLLLDAQSVSFQVEEELRLFHGRKEEIERLTRERNSLRLELENAEKEKQALTAENAALRSENAVASGSLESTGGASYPLLPKEEKAVDLDIIQTANQIIADMSPYSLPNGIQLVLSSSCESLTVHADRNYINILFRNIIDNSIKYMKRNGSLVITISNLADDLFIVLKDNGEGLPQNETEHVFELNYQGSNRVSGNGLGLTQAKAIVEYYGGTIYAKSGNGRGMGVYIQLPSGSGR